MKGDKTIKVPKKSTDFVLFAFFFRNTEVNVEKVFGGDIQQSVIPGSFCRALGDTPMPPICVEKDR